MTSDSTQIFTRIGKKVAPDHSAPDPSKVISGDPQHTTWNCEETADGLYSGLWQTTPGKWQVAYDEWEFCHILEGHSILHEHNGPSHILKTGDSFVIKRGFKGIWEAVETTLKEYVIKL